MLSEIYLEHYKTIMYDFMSDDQELDVSIGKTNFQFNVSPLDSKRQYADGCEI